MRNLWPSAWGRGAFDTLPTMRRLQLADASSTFNPSSRLVASSDVAGGMSFTVAGGWSSDDPGDGPRVTWRLRDLFGRRLPASNTHRWMFLAWLGEKTPPSLTSDLQVLVGLHTGTIEDASGATVDGIWGGLEYTGSSRKARVVHILNGAYVAGGSASGTANNAIRAAQFTTFRCGTGGTDEFGSTMPYYTAFALDSDGNSVLANDASGGATVAVGADPWLSVALTRRTATAGDETWVGDVQYAILPVRARG